MNRPEQPDQLMPIPDVQSGTDGRRLAIDQVGIRGLRYPLAFADHDGVAQGTIAVANVYVALPEDRKGTHMSRLVMLLEERAVPGAPPLSVAGLRRFVEDLVGAARCAGREDRACLPVLRPQVGAGLGHREPPRLRGPARRRAAAKAGTCAPSASRCR